MRTYSEFYRTSSDVRVACGSFRGAFLRCGNCRFFAPAIAVIGANEIEIREQFPFFSPDFSKPPSRNCINCINPCPDDQDSPKYQRARARHWAWVGGRANCINCISHSSDDGGEYPDLGRNDGLNDREQTLVCRRNLYSCKLYKFRSGR